MFLEKLGQALDGAHFFLDVFDLIEYDPAETLSFGDTTVTFRAVQHYVPSYAMRITAGRTLTFSAAAAPCESLIEHASGADVLLCEAALHHTGEDQPVPANRGHLSAAEAGMTATRAGVAIGFHATGRSGLRTVDQATRRLKTKRSRRSVLLIEHSPCSGIGTPRRWNIGHGRPWLQCLSTSFTPKGSIQP